MSIELMRPRGRPAAAPGQGYPPHYLAQKFGITPDQAREVIARVGNDRDKLNEAASKVKRPLIARRLPCPI